MTGASATTRLGGLSIAGWTQGGQPALAVAVVGGPVPTHARGLLAVAPRFICYPYYCQVIEGLQKYT